MAILVESKLEELEPDMEKAGLDMEKVELGKEELTSQVTERIGMGFRSCFSLAKAKMDIREADLRA